MNRPAARAAAGLVALTLLVVAGAPGRGQQNPSGTTKATPKLEPVAETRLLMEGLANANFRGLERILTQKPADVQAWTFARGQALLLAETANLLMVRPPRSQGQPVWFERAAELRTAATQLARFTANQDYERSRTALLRVADTCNRCHHTFRVSVDVVPFQSAPQPKAE
jgi:Cytochrome C'